MEREPECACLQHERYPDDVRWTDFQWDCEVFCNPQITKEEVTVEGLPNQLYSQGLVGLPAMERGS